MPSGVVSTVAGGGASDADGIGTTAGLAPAALAMDASGTFALVVSGL